MIDLKLKLPKYNSLVILVQFSSFWFGEIHKYQKKHLAEFNSSTLRAMEHSRNPKKSNFMSFINFLIQRNFSNDFFSKNKYENFGFGSSWLKKVNLFLYQKSCHQLSLYLLCLVLLLVRHFMSQEFFLDAYQCILHYFFGFVDKSTF